MKIKEKRRASSKPIHPHALIDTACIFLFTLIFAIDLFIPFVQRGTSCVKFNRDAFSMLASGIL